MVRPAGEEWDEKEEFPYPIVEQAKEIGLYSWEFMAEAMMNDPTGLSMPIAIEELFWGDAGIGMATKRSWKERGNVQHRLERKCLARSDLHCM